LSRAFAPIRCGRHHPTFGGLRIDSAARVLNTSLNRSAACCHRRCDRLFFPIIVLLVTRNAVFSWIAGKQAAAVS
jgi:hypothetical protein